LKIGRITIPKRPLKNYKTAHEETIKEIAKLWEDHKNKKKEKDKETNAK
jgi:hypothetical protein